MSLDPYRLPRAVVPQHYDVSLEPELGAATFSGSVAIHTHVQSETTSIVLNAIELDIAAVLVNGQPRPFELDESVERLIIAADLGVGPATIEITFSGTLNDKLRGFYRSTYTDDSGVVQVIACSQMQATDCRRAFPCFDEPDFKATFAITLVVDDGLMAVSNAPERERHRLPSGRWSISFEDTMKMSTYLVALIVGNLEASPVVDVSGTPLRIVHVPGKGHLCEFGLDVGAVALNWFQSYYGIAYPGQKVDMVALPDFAAGAMENLGCITYRESLLLIDPSASTQNEQQLVADVVSHELAHMWFGDLVTMGWWNGIWLNEAFATFMEVMAVEVFRPDWKRWTSFGLERSEAFEVDSLHATRTVEFAVHAPSDCEGMFDVLTYQKGGALLRMLQQYLGEERFRLGVNNYLQSHAYANTETEDLWNGIEAVTSADGGNEPVRQLMDSWIWQPGFPLVLASLAGSTLTLRQQRFSFDLEIEDATIYLVPVSISAGGQTTTVLVDQAEMSVDIGQVEGAILVNAGGHGFYRVGYDDHLRSRLNADALAHLSILERYNLVDDAGAAMVAGRLSAPALLQFLEGFVHEQDLAVWQAVAVNLRRLDRLVATDADHAFQQRVQSLVGPALTQLGWEPSAGENDLRGKLRALLIVLSALFGRDVAALEFCRNLLHNDHLDRDPELIAAATTVVASFGQEAEFNAFVQAFKDSTTPQEQLRYLYALAEFDSEELVRRAAEFAFSSDVRAQNAPYLLNRCITNRHHGAAAWAVVRQHWDQANTQFPNPSIVRMIDPVKLLNTADLVADVQSFFSEHDIPQAVNSLQQVLERQRVNAAMRARESTSLSQALIGDHLG